jgi:hypothetical protein
MHGPIGEITTWDELIGYRQMDDASDAQRQPEARSCVTVRGGLLRVPAQIGQRRT